MNQTIPKSLRAALYDTFPAGLARQLPGGKARRRPACANACRHGSGRRAGVARRLRGKRGSRPSGRLLRQLHRRDEAAGDAARALSARSRWWRSTSTPGCPTCRKTAGCRFTFPPLQDSLGISLERYDVVGTLTSVLIDASGRAFRHVGTRQTPAELSNALLPGGFALVRLPGT